MIDLAVDALGAGLPRSRVGATFAPLEMRAQLTVDVAVVRAAKPKRCEACNHRRIVYALTFTDGLVGNPDHPWRCARCWGLR